MEVSHQLHAPAGLPPGEIVPDTHWIRGWVGPKASLDVVEETLPHAAIRIPVLQLKRLWTCRKTDYYLNLNLNAIMQPIGINCLRSLGLWDLGFEFHLRYGCLVCVWVYSVFVLSCV
jgi:hypothetical protein